MTGPIEDVRVNLRDVTDPGRLIQRLAEETGEIVQIIPPAHGGWRVKVGSRMGDRYDGPDGYETAVCVAANRERLTDRLARAMQKTLPEVER
jgi:hypothetical protein